MAFYIDDQPNKCKSYHITNGNVAARKRIDLLTRLGCYLYKCKSKFIPGIYKTAGERDRLEILVGLVDTDGSLSKGYYDVLKSKLLADDIAFVARSLGFQSIVKECQKEATNGSSGKKNVLQIINLRRYIKNSVQSQQKNSRNKETEEINQCFIYFCPILRQGSYYGFELHRDYKLFY